MDRSTRVGDPFVAMQAIVKGNRAGIWTALPAILQSYDPAKRTCTAQPAIQAQVLSQQGQWTFINLPICVDCPVMFPAGGGFSLTFPLAAGDEGLLVFSSRCIDSWWQNGGVQNQLDLRMHDLSDGFFIPGAFSQPRLADVPAASTDSVRLTANDGETYVELAEGQIVNVVAPGGLNVTGNMLVRGNVSTEAYGGSQGNMSIAGGSVVTGDLEIQGDTLLDGALDVTGDIATNANIIGQGNLSMTGTVTCFFGTGLFVTLHNHRHAANNVPPTPGF